MKTLYSPGQVFAPPLCLSHVKKAAMDVFRVNLRLLALVTLVFCSGLSANAQSVTVSPSNLSFGVPTGSTVSAAQAVNISVNGTGNTLAVTNVGITVNNEATGTADFTQTNTCSGTVSAPGSCTVSVTFTPSAPAGVLESATLNVTYTLGIGGGEGSTTANVPLTGALGAIRLFDPVNEANSNVNATLSSLVTFDSTTLTLSCPASPTAVISSSPDGSGYVLVDNFLTLFVGPNPFTQTTASGLIGNVCPGNLGNPSDAGQPDCFTSAYQQPASANSLDGQNPDTFTNPGNTNPFLSGAPGGVPPINVSGLLAALGSQGQATFSLLDGGGKVTSTTLFLVTSCSLTNASTGTETGNAVNQQPSQTLNFDTVAGNTDEYAFDYSLVPPGAITNFDSTPVVTNNSISPAAYLASVANTPFANTSCIPLASLGGNCALKTQVCAPPPPSTAPAAGVYCPQTSAPDFLFTSTFDPVTPISNPNSTFGFLEFNDAGSCPLEGPEAGSSCPQNGLVSFSGPGLNVDRTGAGSTNSSRIVIAGVTPPTTSVVVTPFYSTGPASGWTNGSPTATFVGNPAAITGSFAAPINFIDYGINPTSQGEPPTFPIPFPGNGTFGPDNVLQNPATCPASYTAPPLQFTPAQVSLGTFADGSSNLLHYSSTDCAGTHELQFTLANGSWATSLKSLTLQTDTQPPTINITTPARTTYSAYQKVKAAYCCIDTESLVASCAGTVPLSGYIDTTPTSGLSTPKSFTVNAMDNVGNAAFPLTVNYSVSCNYAAVGVSPSTVSRPAFVSITASVIDCMSAPQNVKVQFSVSGPIGKNCSNASSVLWTTPTFTIKSGTSNSLTFPFPIAKNACPGTYTVTTTTLQGATTIDSVNSTLTVH